MNKQQNVVEVVDFIWNPLKYLKTIIGKQIL